MSTRKPARRLTERLTGWLRHMFPAYEPYVFVVDYKRRDESEGRNDGHLVNIGWFVNGLPRLIWLCRVSGHRPVVDGTAPMRTGSYVSQAYLWVRCARCGERGNPQGSLDPSRWRIGQRYTGGWEVPTGRAAREREEELERLARGELPRFADRGLRLELPGPIGTPAGRKFGGSVGGQLVIGGGYPGFSCEFKVGNRFSEQTLAAHLRLGRLAALYLHTEKLGWWVTAWLNPWSETSKLTGIHAGDGRAGWRLWANRWHGHEPDISEPWWRHTDINIRVLDRLLGPKRYSYTSVDLNNGQPVTRVVRMPERDYLVKLTLQQCVLGRKRQWRKRKQTWNVEWETLGPGIPFRTGNSWKGDDITASGVEVSNRSVRQGTWPAAAVAAIAVDMTRMRTNYGWDPIAVLPLQRPTGAHT